MSAAANSQEIIKKPNVSGQFYSSSPKELSEELDFFFSQAAIALVEQRVEIIISPHAGYVYSGPIAAYGYKAASKSKYSTIVVIAPSHYVNFPNVSIWPEGSFETPLGSISVDADFAKKLTAQNKEFSFVRAAFTKEHSLEVQLPFLQKTFKDFKIVPIIIGDASFEACQDLAQGLKKVIGDRDDVLIVISTDMSHYHSAKVARGMDQQAIDLVRNLEAKELWQKCSSGKVELCGFMPVTTALLYAKEKGLGAQILKYGDSGDASGDKESVVGYFSAIFFKSDKNGKQEEAKQIGNAIPLSLEQKKRLLEIARKTIFEYVKNGKVLDFKEVDPRLLKEEGAFVTLHEHGQLRGCIGNIIGQGPLFLTVRDMAIASSTEDPRFQPVSKDELDKLEIEISVLSKPWKVKNPNEIELGVHGVIVSKGLRRGLFLPQVATEQGWSREQLLSYLCAEKAGLPADAWKDPSVIIEVFTAQVFSEKEF
jgi:hypothetical protein